MALGALAQADDVGMLDMFQTSPAKLALARCAFERGQHALAGTLLDDLAPVTDRHRDRGPQLAVAVLRSRLASVAGDTNAGFALLDDVRAVRPEWPVPAAGRAALDEQEVRLCLLAGDLGAARAVLTRLQTLEADAPDVVVACQISAARVLAAEGRPDDAARALVDVALSPAAAGAVPRMVECLVEAAAAARAARDTASAQLWLRRALALAEPESLTGAFMREAPAVRPLLLHMESDADFPLLGFRRRLLSLLDVPPRRASVVAVAVAVAVGRLSDRELVVLRLLGGDLPNGQIAEALHLSRNTLKTHVRHVYRKLAVTTRAEAVARARELELL